MTYDLDNDNQSLTLFIFYIKAFHLRSTSVIMRTVKCQINLRIHEDGTIFHLPINKICIQKRSKDSFEFA